MFRARWQRIVLAGGAVVAFLVVTLVGYRILTPSADGPLQMRAQSMHVKAQARAGETIRFEADIPFNPTPEDIHIRSVSLIGVRGLDVVGVVLSYPTLRPDGTCLSAGNGDPFPPPGRTAAVEDAILPSAGTRMCENEPEISIGVRTKPGATSGAIDGVVVLYEARGSVYQIDLAQSYDVVPPEY